MKQLVKKAKVGKVSDFLIFTSWMQYTGNLQLKRNNYDNRN